MFAKSWATILVVLLITPLAFSGEDKDGKATNIPNTFANNLEIISWVEVDIQGNLLKEHKSYFEKLVRLRLKNDLSMMAHEYENPNVVWEKYNYDWYGIECKKRGWVECGITILDEYVIKETNWNWPIAYNVDCRIYGHGKYLGELYSFYGIGYMGITKKNTLKKDIEEGLRSNITQISMTILEKRTRPQNEKSPVNHK